MYAPHALVLVFTINWLPVLTPSGSTWTLGLSLGLRLYPVEGNVPKLTVRHDGIVADLYRAACPEDAVTGSSLELPIHLATLFAGQ